MKAIGLLLLCAVVAGCGGLDRSTAKALIDANHETHLKDKVVYPITLGLTWACPTVSGDPMYRFLLKKKLIKVTQPSDLELTPEGAKLFEAEGEKLYAPSSKPGCDIAQQNVVLGHRSEAEVTGIALNAGGTAATVQYDRTVTLTELGGEFASFRRTFNLEERISWRESAAVFDIPDGFGWVNKEAHEARFVKFDDGWRIVSIK